MMIATWAGAHPADEGPDATGKVEISDVAAMSRFKLMQASLDLHNLFFLSGEKRIDLADRLIGRLLDLLFLAPLLVLAHGAVLLQLLEQVDAVPSHVPDGDARLLGVFMRHLDHLLAALLVHLGNAQADGLAFRQRVE